MDGVTNFRKYAVSGLDEQQPFACALNFALPAVNRGDLRHDIYTGGKTAFHQSMRKFFSFVFRRRGGEHDACLGHGIFPLALILNHSSFVLSWRYSEKTRTLMNNQQHATQGSCWRN